MICTLMVVAAVFGSGTSGAQTERLSDAKRTTAELRIGLPVGSASEVTVEPGDRLVVLTLPRGSEFPLDFAAASGGLLRTGEITPLDGERVRLELELARGVLERIEYRPTSVVLTLESRTRALRPLEESGEGYRLGPDDRIEITVHNQPELASALTVTREGTITAPMVGEIEVAGLSPREVAVKLAELLGRDYLVDPEVDVKVEEYRSQWVMVTGEVRVTGRIPLRGGTRLKEVLSEAGGFRSEAGQEIRISRKRDDSDEYEVRRVERAAFEKGEGNPLLRHGEIVEVPPAAFCYVQGEVRSPGKVRVERGTTLLRAVAQVGGLTEWANKKTVKVLYDDGDEGPRMAVYNLKKIQAGRAEDPMLRGGEKIVVERRYF